MSLFGEEKVKKSELEQWFEDRYSHLEDKIRVVEWKGRQQELYLLLQHFGLGDD